VKKYTPSYNEYKLLWEDQMEVISRKKYRVAVEQALSRLPKLKDIRLGPEDWSNSTYGFDYWNRDDLFYVPRDDRGQNTRTASTAAKSHVVEVMVEAITASQLRPEKFSTVVEEEELWGAKNIFDFLSRVDTVDIFVHPQNKVNIAGILSQLPLASINISSFTVRLCPILYKIKSSNLTNVGLSGLIDLKGFEAFIMQHPEIRHLRICRSKIKGGHWSELLLLVQKNMKLSSLRLEALYVGDPPRLLQMSTGFRLTPAERYFIKSAKECNKCGLENPFIASNVTTQ
jgi:hypothetical protein